MASALPPNNLPATDHPHNQACQFIGKLQDVHPSALNASVQHQADVSRLSTKKLLRYSGMTNGCAVERGWLMAVLNLGL